MAGPLGTLGRHAARNAVAYLALFLALGGTAYGAAKFTGADIIDNSIFAVDIGQNGVGSDEIAAGAVGPSEIQDNALVGADIDESTLEGVVKGSGEVWDFTWDMAPGEDLFEDHLLDVGTSKVDLVLSCSSDEQHDHIGIGVKVIDQELRDLELALEAPTGPFIRATASSQPVGFLIDTFYGHYDGFFRIQAQDADGRMTNLTGYVFPTDAGTSSAACHFRGQALISG